MCRVTTGRGRELGPLDLHVWLARPEEVTDPALAAAYEALESGEERACRLRLRSDEHRRERLVSVALLRTTLSRYVKIDPAAWTFERLAEGRPELVPGQCDLPLRFNVSHTAGLVACAVTVGRDVGVDVEWTGRRGETVAVADRYFSPAESRALNAFPASRQRERFFEYWTLKESYIKARGLGLRIPLGRFSFRIEDGEPVAISFDPEIEDDPSAWQFTLDRPSSEHVLAVAVRRGAERDLTVRIRHAVPLRDAGA